MKHVTVDSDRDASPLRDLEATKHSPDKVMEDAPIPLSTPCQEVPELLKAARNASGAEERVLYTPESV
jgi:hypothetical protein